MISGGIFLAEYVTSDWHFGDIKIGNTLETRKEYVGKENIMNETIVRNINKVLTNSDTLYHLGDTSHLKYNAETLFLVSQIKGQIVFIFGNHDKKEKMDFLKKYNFKLPDGRWKFKFEEAGVIKEHDGKLFYLTHFPLDLGEHRKNVRSIHGHMHMYASEKSNAINISIDSPELPPKTPFGQPILLEKAMKLVNAKWETNEASKL